MIWFYFIFPKGIVDSKCDKVTNHILHVHSDVLVKKTTVSVYVGFLFWILRATVIVRANDKELGKISLQFK